MKKNVWYMNCKKHYCQECRQRLEKIQVSKIVNSYSPEVKRFDFWKKNHYMLGNVKFIWTEFRCPACGKQFSIDEMKKIEKEKRK